MRNLIFILFILVSFCQQANSEDKYKSAKEDEYYEKLNYKEYSPPDIEQVKRIPYDYLDVQETLNKPKTKWQEVYEFTNFQDSLFFMRFRRMEHDFMFNYKFLPKEILFDKNFLKSYQDSVFAERIQRRIQYGSIKFPDSTSRLKNQWLKEFQKDQKEFFEDGNYEKWKTYYKLYFAKYGPIFKKDIILSGKYENQIAILYFDRKYDDLMPGYWLAVLNNNGNSWKNYYTGLSKGHFYSINCKSDLPIWKNDSLLQFNAALVCRNGEFIHPGPGPKFKLIYHVLLTMNLNKMCRDSDGDGLTDIEEQKMMLNPQNVDTDGDGIPDKFDKNPRYKSASSENTLIYEMILEPKKIIMPFDSVKYNYEEIVKSRKESENIEKTYLIVTDDDDLKQINPIRHRFIILTEDEYQEHQKNYPISFSKYSISPFFKCDNLRNSYKLRAHVGTGSSTYLIRKHEEGFFVTTISRMIY